jgi:glycosyltransferase involved in cell wall biosynthesis
VAEFDQLPPRETLRRWWLSGYEGPVILFLGRLTYKKGVDLLIRAFGHTRAAVDARLVIAGPDDEGLTAGLQQLARELGVGDDVAFIGPVYGEDRLAALSAADVWALSSHTENFGIAVVEAMAAGTAVVVSPAVNLAEDITAADAGIVAELEPGAFGAALTDVLTDDLRRRSLQRRAREFARRYDWRVVAPEFAEMYHAAAHANK